jgi:hypothetical protein
VDVYVDESGDLGFNRGSSRYLIIAYLITDDSEAIKRVLKKYLHGAKRKRLTRKELKFSNSNKQVRQQVLSKLLEADWNAGLIILDKSLVKPELKEAPDALYNYTLLESLMRDLLDVYDNASPINIYVDRSKNKRKIRDFNIYAQGKASYIWGAILRRPVAFNLEKLRIEHPTSTENRCIQAADFVSGAAFQKYERGDSTFLDIISGRISRETLLWR